MKLALALSASFLLSGCLAVLDGAMQNRIACTVARDKAFFVSEYGPVGVSAVIDQRDAAVLCK